MSHFAVLVITPPSQKPLEDILTDALQPYHEFECTGTDDQYVQDVDKTEEARQKYAEDTTRICVNKQTGWKESAYADRFYRDPTEEEQKQVNMGGTGWSGDISYHSKDWQDGKGYRAKVHYMPDGWEEKEVPTSEVETFSEWAEGYYGSKILRQGEARTDDHKYGWLELDESGNVVRLIDRTNPNAKWDWWQVGGRYSNRLLFGNGATGDSCEKRGINFHQMALNKAADATHEWNLAQTAFGDTEPCECWSVIMERHKGDREKAREEYRAQPRVKAWDANTKGSEVFGFFSSPEDYQMPLAEFLSPKVHALTAFAIVKDGQWYERGSMGWWGCVSDEKDEGEWNSRVAELLKTVPDDHTITVVDCHI